MSRTDVEPSRLEAATRAARAFLDGLPPDLSVGLVTFAGTSEALVPPTTAHERILGALDRLPRGEGTVIGDGMTTALEAIRAWWSEEGEAPAAIVVLSDGRDTGSAIAPEQAAARARELGIPIYTVVLGRDLTGERAGANVDLMARIAETTDGSAFTATTAGGLLDVYETLRTRLSTELAVTDFGAFFIAAAGALAVAATVALLVAIRSEP
jgi:Ca-activated chloride channel family protein